MVTHADGVDFLMEGASDKKNPDTDYDSLVSALKERGVRLEVCAITLRSRSLKEDQFHHGRRVNAFRRSAHWTVTGARAPRLHQALTDAHQRWPGAQAGLASALRMASTTAL